ncbi:MAG: Holliday junction branch migration protein RuvA [Deltaproteobacteria bacterium]|nr:Holliday junction branch migration protein RuvA [Deltaproteobacteria bacterium]
MIDHLRGRFTGGGKDFVVVECAGVGFRVHVSSVTRAELPSEGEACLIRTHLHMREGGADLFGFSTETEREVFLALTGVSGVGPKSAIAVISTMGVGGILAGVSRGDAVPFTRVPGIGKKLAQRIANELPDRLKKVSIDLEPASAVEAAVRPETPEAEAVEALVSLGYARGEAQIVASRLRKEIGSEAPAEALVREALRRLSGAGR